MSFDLNGDGKKEYINCGYWDRWGVLTGCFLSGKSFSYGIEGHCKRLGVLSSRSGNWHDLVCDYNEIIQFDGENSYKLKD